MEFEIKGFENLFNDVNFAEENVEKQFRKTVNRVSGVVKAKAIANTPVAKKNGGTLRRNWHFRTKNALEGVIYNNTSYALMWGM